MITNSELELIARDVAETLTGREHADDAAPDPGPSEPDTRDEARAG